MVGVDDIRAALEVSEELAGKYGRSFLVAFVAGVGGFAPEARRYYIEWKRRHPEKNRWSVVIGTSLAVRTLVTLVLRGTSLLTGISPTVFMVEDEAAAEAKIEQIKEELRAKAGPDPR